MRNCFLFILFLGGVAYAAPSFDTPAIQELRLSLEDISRQIHNHSVDVTLFQERVTKLEQALKQGLKNGNEKLFEKRLLTLEKANDTLIADLKTLKSHLNETNTTLSKIDKQISSDIQSLKTSLHSMLALLQGEQKSYTVQAGDSLGQIALDHKTDTKTLKKLNNLSSDTIFSGQKLLLP